IRSMHVAQSPPARTLHVNRRGHMGGRARNRLSALTAVLLLVTVLPSAGDVAARSPSQWSVTGRMTTARAGQTATLLPNGKVLVAGGSGLSSAELYDPRKG